MKTFKAQYGERREGRGEKGEGRGRENYLNTTKPHTRKRTYGPGSREVESIQGEKIRLKLLSRIKDSQGRLYIICSIKSDLLYTFHLM